MNHCGKLWGGALALALIVGVFAGPAIGANKGKQRAGGAEAPGQAKPHPGNHLGVGHTKRKATAAKPAAAEVRSNAGASRKTSGAPHARARAKLQTKTHAAKVTICHFTGSETNPFVVITVAASAWRSLEAKGDILAEPNGCGARQTGETPGDGADDGANPTGPNGVLSETVAERGDLPFTGLPVWPLLIAGGVLIASGLALRRFGNPASR
jgi:hypothetical protein